MKRVPDIYRDEWAIAIGVAFIAQFGFLLMMATPAAPQLRADISDEQAKPIAVSITPILNAPLLKQGVRNPTQNLPDAWQRAKPKPKSDAPVPSPQALQTPEAIPTTSAPVAGPAPTVEVEAGAPTALEVPDSSATAPVSSELGDPGGVKGGTETDPLKARALDQYKAQVTAFFLSRFRICPEVDPDKRKDLKAVASLSIGDRKLTSFSVTPSGDSVFDSGVQSTLGSIQSGGVELPAPPPMYPEFLKSHETVVFRCRP